MTEEVRDTGINMDRSLSGMAYVLARYKGGGTQYDKIIIAADKNCGHTSRICAECADAWNSEYELLYSRTAGGRALFNRMVKKQ